MVGSNQVVGALVFAGFRSFQYRMINYFKYMFLGASILALISGCALFTSWSGVMEGWHGRNIKEIIDLWGPADRVDDLPDGLQEYKYHLKDLDPTCVHYWITLPEGTIKDHRHEGYCRPVG